MQNSKRRNLILSAMLLFIASTACSSFTDMMDNYFSDDRKALALAQAQTREAFETNYTGTAVAQTQAAFGTMYVGTADAKRATAQAIDNSIAQTVSAFQTQTQAAKLPAEEQPAEGIQPPTATVTQTGAHLSDDLSCTMTVLVNLFCRPAPGYAPSDSFTPGLSAEVVGYSSDRLYAFVIGPKGRVCTVPTDPKLVELTGGGCERLPQYTLLPPPTSTSTPTFTPSPTMYPTYTPTVLMPSATATISPTP